MFLLPLFFLFDKSPFSLLRYNAHLGIVFRNYSISVTPSRRANRHPAVAAGNLCCFLAVHQKRKLARAYIVRGGEKNPCPRHRASPQHNLESRKASPTRSDELDCRLIAASQRGAESTTRRTARRTSLETRCSIFSWEASPMSYYQGFQTSSCLGALFSFFPALDFFAFRFANDAAFYGARVNRPARIVSSECHLMFYFKILIREPQFGTRFFIWHQPKGTEPIQGTKPEKSAQSGRRFDQMCP